MARKLVLLVLALSLCSFLALAQSKEYSRIARLSYLEGKVSFQHTDEVDWTAASINMALQPGDRLYTGDTGRAEVEFDDGSVIRLAEKTDVEILTMQEQLIQMKVLIGLCSLTNRSNVQFEIDTPAAAFTTSEKGSYRFDIADNGDSDGIVRKGILEVANNHFSRRLVSGELLHVPAAEGSTEVLARYDQRDAWDEWNDRRNAESVAVESRKYIADTVYIGMNDLDRYGYWTSVDGYGPAWVPRVDMGWSPYWDGRWQYRPLWGWTWVSYEPWGWLPYHYGRWYNTGSFGWCWIPGASFGFHFWSPGLVRFYRGDNWVSWLPLGPGDYYDINNYHFNFGNRANLYYLNELRLMQRRGPDDLINRHNVGAFRSVRTDAFVNGSFGPKAEQVRISDPRQSGRVVTGNLDIRPNSNSFAPAPGRASQRPETNSRAVVVRNEPQSRARGERFVAITNPQFATPRTRTDQAAGEMRGTPNSNSRSVPERTVLPNRNYNTSQSRPVVNSQTQQGTGAQANPRSQATSRTQQSTVPSRRADSPPSVGSSGSSSSGRFDTGASASRPVYSGSSQGVTSRQMDRPTSVGTVSSPNYDRSTSVSSPASAASSAGAASAAGNSRQTSAPPAGGAGAAAAPVKKSPEPQTSSNYAPRQYQSYRSQTSAPSGVASEYGSSARAYSSTPASRNAGRVETRTVPQYTAPRASETPSNARVARTDYGASSSTARSYGSARSAAPQYSAPRSVAPQYSAPQTMSRSASQYSAQRSSPQMSAPRAAPQSSTARSAPSNPRRR